MFVLATKLGEEWKFLAEGTVHIFRFTNLILMHIQYVFVEKSAFRILKGEEKKSFGCLENVVTFQKS